MKYLRPILFLLIPITAVFSQDDCQTLYSGTVIESNRMAVRINNNGTLFHDGEQGFFKVPYTVENSPGTIRKAGLWIGGVDPGGNLKVAASTLSTEDNTSDFVPGPLNPKSGKPYEQYPCDYFNHVWTVTWEDIRTHLADWLEDGKIQHPVPAVFNWPGNGNPHFRMDLIHPPGMPESRHGYAPFFDQNSDGIYDPMEGDFPTLHLKIEHQQVIPKEMSWTVFHESKEKLLTGALPLQVEVQQTTWVMDCKYNPSLEDVLFADYKFINYARESLDTAFAGFWIDFDLGCPEDDYLGSLPSSKTFYAYNMNDQDGQSGECAGEGRSYGGEAVAQSFSVLSHEYPLSSFTYYFQEDFPNINMEAPELDFQIYNYMSGTWKDGTPFSVGGNGYDVVNTDLTKFVFHDNPSDPDGWSMHREMLPAGDRIAVGAVPLKNIYYPAPRDEIRPGEMSQFVVAFGFHHKTAEDHVSIIDAIERTDLDLYRDYFFAPRIGVPGPHVCENFFHYSDYDETPEIPVGIYPNPTTGLLTISLPETSTEEVIVYNTAWQQVLVDREIKTEVYQLDLSFLPAGLYFLRLKLNGQFVVEKVVIGPG